MRSWEQSQQRLGLHKVDILYMHDISHETHGTMYPAHFRTAMEGGYRAMDELRRAGDVRAIGLGVNEWECCMEAMDHGAWDVFLVASRFTLLEQGPLDSFLPRCACEGASVVIGKISAGNASTRRMFAMFDPMMLPWARPALPVEAACTEITDRKSVV